MYAPRISVCRVCRGATSGGGGSVMIGPVGARVFGFMGAAAAGLGIAAFGAGAACGFAEGILGFGTAVGMLTTLLGLGTMTGICVFAIGAIGFGPAAAGPPGIGADGGCTSSTMIFVLQFGHGIFLPTMLFMASMRLPHCGQFQSISGGITWCCLPHAGHGTLRHRFFSSTPRHLPQSHLK